MKVHKLVQGSAEWHQFRLTHFGASEAAAMLGLSPNMPVVRLKRLRTAPGAGSIEIFAPPR